MGTVGWGYVQSGRGMVKGASRAGSQRGEGTPVGTRLGVYLIYTGLPCREYSQWPKEIEGSRTEKEESQRLENSHIKTNKQKNNLKKKEGKPA